jgi:hypothetical protein
MEPDKTSKYSCCISGFIQISLSLWHTHTHTYCPFERGPHYWLCHLAVYDSFLVVGCPCVSWCIKPSGLVTHVHIPESLQKLNYLTDFSSFCWWIQSTVEHTDFLLWHELYSIVIIVVTVVIVIEYNVQCSTEGSFIVEVWVLKKLYENVKQQIYKLDCLCLNSVQNKYSKICFMEEYSFVTGSVQQCVVVMLSHW